MQACGERRAAAIGSFWDVLAVGAETEGINWLQMREIRNRENKHRSDSSYRYWSYFFHIALTRPSWWVTARLSPRQKRNCNSNTWWRCEPSKGRMKERSTVANQEPTPSLRLPLERASVEACEIPSHLHIDFTHIVHKQYNNCKSVPSVCKETWAMSMHRKHALEV